MFCNPQDDRADQVINLYRLPTYMTIDWLTATAAWAPVAL